MEWEWRKGQGLICVGTVENAAPILIFRWERRSHTYSYFPMETQFLQRSVTISIRPILVAQQTTILPLMNVFIYLQAVLRIKLGPVIAHRHSNCPPPFPSLPLPPSVSPPHSPSISGAPPLPSNTASGCGGALGAPPAGPGRVWPPNAFRCILVKKIFAFGLP